MLFAAEAIILPHANPDRRRRCRYRSLLAAADVSRGQPGRARARHQDRRRRCGARGRGLHRLRGELAVAIRSASSAPACLAGRRSAHRASAISAGFRWRKQRSAGTEFARALAVSRHDASTTIAAAVRPDHRRAQAGRSLDEFDLPQLLAMVSGFDAESVALLESYLDRRFPAWRQNAQGDAAGGQRRAAAAAK